MSISKLVQKIQSPPSPELMLEVAMTDKMHIYMVIIKAGRRDIEVQLNSFTICFI
jgi:hypothetical protein